MAPRAGRTQPAARKGRPTANDARRKRAQVLAVASDQFSELGYRAVTMRGVAARARVSTRTLYNCYADKLSLFTACLDFRSPAFPTPDPAPGEGPDQVLQRYAAAIVRELLLDSSLRLIMLVYSEGREFPELLRAAEARENRVLVQPLAVYLREVGLEHDGGEERSKLFIAMALSQWQGRRSYRRPLPREVDVVGHATLVARTFLRGIGPVDDAA